MSVLHADKPWRERTTFERRRIRQEVEKDFMAIGYPAHVARELALLSERWADEMDPPRETGGEA